MSERNAGEWAAFRCFKAERAGPGHEAPLQDNKSGDVCNQEALSLSGSLGITSIALPKTAFLNLYIYSF